MRFPDVSGLRTGFLAAPRGLQQCQPGNAGGLGPQDARTEAHRRYKGMPEHGVKLCRCEAAFGTDQEGGRRAACGLGGCALVRSMAAYRVRAGGQSASRPGRRRGACRTGTVRRSHCSAASVAMAARRASLTRAALVRSVRTGSSRRGAEFGGLLHDQVRGVALQQGEHEPEVGLGCLRATLGFDGQGGAVAAQVGDACRPTRRPGR